MGKAKEGSIPPRHLTKPHRTEATGCVLSYQDSILEEIFYEHTPSGDWLYHIHNLPSSRSTDGVATTFSEARQEAIQHLVMHGDPTAILLAAAQVVV